MSIKLKTKKTCGKINCSKSVKIKNKIIIIKNEWCKYFSCYNNQPTLFV